MNTKNGSKLTPIQQFVCLQNGTEPPFANEYWNNKEAGIYVDIISGIPLFSSLQKYDSGSGWPSFFSALNETELAFRIDHSRNMVRTEVRSRSSDAHLGHLFNDGPPPTGKRFCINSAALRFIPLRQMENEGYANLIPLFSEYIEKNTQTATLAGGCFWEMEAYFRLVPGVLVVKTGYSGGNITNPDYQTVCTGDSGHAEAVEIKFDPQLISFRQILLHFFRIHDPTSLNRQGNDSGSQYRSAIFFENKEQEKIARELINKLKTKFKRPIVTEVVALRKFWPAEEYHQRYLQKNPGGYCHIDLNLANRPLEEI